MILHQPALQTPAKIIEMGIIDNLFLNLKSTQLAGKIFKCENGVYTVNLAANIQLFVCNELEFIPVEEGYIYDIQSNSNKQWFNVVYGEASVFRFMNVVEGAERYSKEDSTGKTDTAFLHYLGKDELELNDSVCVDRDLITAVQFNLDLDLLLFRYSHTNKKQQIVKYYKNNALGFYEPITDPEEITHLKDNVRRIIKNAEAISRLSTIQKPE